MQGNAEDATVPDPDNPGQMKLQLCTVENAAEQDMDPGLNAHWLKPGDVYPGYTRGTDPNNNDQPLVVICARTRRCSSR